MELIERLRRAATAMEEWDSSMNPPYSDWSTLMEEAADVLESLTEEED